MYRLIYTRACKAAFQPCLCSALRFHTEHELGSGAVQEADPCESTERYTHSLVSESIYPLVHRVIEQRLQAVDLHPVGIERRDTPVFVKCEADYIARGTVAAEFIENRAADDALGGCPAFIVEQRFQRRTDEYVRHRKQKSANCAEYDEQSAEPAQDSLFLCHSVTFRITVVL